MDNSKLYKYEIVHLNVRGARSNKENLEQYLADMNFPEIVSLNETKLPRNRNFEIANYNLVTRREHSDIGGSRGSLILTRHDLKDVIEIEEVKEIFQHDKVLGVEVKRTDQRPGIKVFSYYNPPLCNPNEAVLQYVANTTGCSVLTGDINCKHTIWGSTKNEKRGIELLNALNRMNLHVFNDDSKTRCDPVSGKEESLDLVIGNDNAMRILSDYWVGLDIGSDHYPVHAILQFGIPTPDNPHLVRRITNLNLKKWEKILNGHPRIGAAQNPSSLDSNAELVTDQIMKAFKESCPEKKIMKKAKCEFTPEIRACVKEKRKLRRQKNVALQNDDQVLVRQIMTQINKLGNDIKRLQKQEKKAELLKHCSRLNTEKNSKKFFETFNIIANPLMKNDPKASTLKPVQDELGNIASTSQEKSRLFANRLQRTHQEPDYKGFDDKWKKSVEHFIEENKKAFTTEMGDSYVEQEDGDDSILLQRVTMEELQENLRNCKNRSAAGEDGISYLMLKRLPPQYMENLCQIYSDAIRLGHFPITWKSAVVKMLPKPQKDAKLAKNYRPISLLSCVGKILERIIARRVSNHLESENLLSTSQSGFRSHRMTAEQLLRLSEESHRAFKKKKVTAALFLDAEAAFDRCWHNGIKYKLKNNYNLPNRTVRLISSFLTGRTLTVLYEGCRSHIVHLHAGTPQGSPLSPLIYIMYVNDYPGSLSEICSLSQFADDTALWTQAFTKAIATRKLQRALNSLEGWCRQWRVKLNGEKSHLLFITRSNEKDNENYSLHLFDDIVRPVESAKFLGVEIDSKLSFKRHVESICNRSRKRIQVLSTLARAGVEPPILMRLYQCYILSLIEYGSPSFIAAPKKQLDCLQKIQNDAIRACLRLPSYIRTSLIHEYAGIAPVKERLKSTSTRLLGKMRSHNEHVKQLMREHDDFGNSQPHSPLDILMAE